MEMSLPEKAVFPEETFFAKESIEETGVEIASMSAETVGRCKNAGEEVEECSGLILPGENPS